MQQRLKYIIFYLAIIIFLSVYQILLFFLNNEDGISITLIATSSPYWAYFIDGYHIIYTLSWLLACSLLWFFPCSFLRPIKRHTKAKYRLYTVGYNIVLYAIGIYMLSTLTAASMAMRLIPFILAIIMFGIIYVVYHLDVR